MATQNLGSILVRSIQFEEKGPLFRRGDANAETIVIQGGTLEGAGHVIEEDTVPLAARAFLNFGAGLLAVDDGAGPDRTTVTATGAGIDHGLLTGLGDDDHTIYALLLGRAGGQTLIGGTAASNDLVVRASSNATEGNVVVEDQTNTPLVEVLRVRSARATRADNDTIFITFYHPNGAGTQTEFGRITSRITDIGGPSGDLVFEVPSEGSGIEVLTLQGDTGNVIVDETQSGTVDFKVHGGVKLNLISTSGINNTVGIGSAGISGPMLLVTEENDAVSQEILRIRSNRATRAANDEIFVTFNQPTANGTLEEYGRITSIAVSVTDLAETGALDINIPDAGVDVRLWNMGPNNTFFSPDNDDINFVIRSTLLTCAFEMDSGRNTVGIGQGATTNVQLSVVNSWLDTPLINIMRLQSARTTRADDDEIYITFLQPNSVGSPFEFGRITVAAGAVASGSEGGDMTFDVSCASSGGTPVEILRLDGSSATAVAVFNVATQDVDFRVSGVTEADMVFMDASAEVLGLGGPVTTARVTITDNQDIGNLELLRLVSNRATPTNGDQTRMDWYLENSVGTSHIFGQIRVNAVAIASGSEGGRMEFYASCPSSGGGVVRMLDVDANAEAVVVNPISSGVVDLIVNAQGIANIIRVDSGTNNIGMGGTPSSATFFSLEPGAANRTRVTGIAIGMNFPAEVYTQLGASTVAIGAMIGYDIPSFAAAGASTITDAATLYIQGAPTAGANMTLTRTFALWVDGGITKLDGNLQLDADIVMNAAVAQLISGATSFAIRNSIDTADNMLLTDSGVMSIRTGLTVLSGGLAVDDGVSVIEDDTLVTTAPLQIINSAGGATWNVLDLIGDDTTVGVANEPVFMRIVAPDSVGTRTEMVRIAGQWTDPAAGSKDSQFEVFVWQANSFNPVFRVNSSGGFEVFGFFGNNAIVATLTQTFSTVDATHALRTAAALTDNTTGAAPDGTIADLTAFAASVAWDGATVFPSAADEAAIALIVTQTRDAVGELADQINKVIADQVDTASFLNSLVDALQAHGIAA